MNTPSRSSSESGQVLALFAIGFMAMVAMVALVVDGGNAFAMHRQSQNGSDASAQAGAVVLGEARVGADKSDTDVKDAIDGVLTAMEMDLEASSAEYTDIDGNGLGIAVGSRPGQKPPDSAFGVAVSGKLPFGTYVARAIGLSEMTADTSATAIAGYGQPVGTTLLPITPPITVVTCDGQNNPLLEDLKWGKGVLYKVPLCKNGPGNVGWLDWTDATAGNQGGGKDEIVEQIKDPNIPPPGIKVPGWHFVAETGNPNSQSIQDALRAYDGEIVLIPLFDATCDTTPQPNDDGVSACPPENQGGHGAKQWYHFPEFAAFQLCTSEKDADGDNKVHKDCLPHGSYVNGSNKAECDTGNGATSCLVGKFTDFYAGPGYVTGDLDATAGPSDFMVVQLIK